MPQLNPEFFISQLFWLVIFFSLLFVILWKISLPRIGKVIEKRQNKINDNLSTAKELQQEAQEIEKKINVKINKAKEETNEQIKKTIISLQEETASKLLSLDEELGIKINNAEKVIAKSKENQMKIVQDEISNITKITVAKITDINLSESVIDQAIKSYKGKIN